MVSDADEYTDKGKGHKDVNIRSNIMLNMLYEAIKSLAENIWGALEAVSTAMVSAIVGVDIREVKKAFDKSKLKDTKKNEIVDSIDVVSQKLEESKEIIDNALLEMENQKKLFEQMKKEAEISQQVMTMNKEQIDALNILLENTLNRQEKKSFPKNFLWNLFFCVLSAILGFLLGKFI